MQRSALLVLLFCTIGMSRCATAPPADPIKALRVPRASPSSYLAAMEAMDTREPSAAYVNVLTDIVRSNAYIDSTRREAYQRAARLDSDALEICLYDALPLIQPPDFRRWVLQQIALEKRTALAKAIIRSWARPLPAWEPDRERLEPKTLAALFGEDRVAVVLLQTLIEAHPIIEANLRARSWELLVETGQTDRLRVLLSDDETIGQDGLLRDMRASMNDFGIIPRNREEILWMRELRKPERRVWWNAIAKALAGMDEQRLLQLETRDLAVAVAADQHHPALLAATTTLLYDELETQLSSDGVRYSPDFSGWTIKISESIQDDKTKLTWGDLAAMTLAKKALESEALRAHIFDFADRDQVDRATEYGGIIRMDDAGRFELIEFPPRSRVADDRYMAPQSLFDAGYTALFHVHNHAQTYNNRRYAGPHLGDFDYADETGANGLVFTFIDRDQINIDYYRHDTVVVDLGLIQRPGSVSASQ